MNGNKPNPPTSAIWLLRHVCPGRDNDALTGDLLERFREGQTRGWFWKQVLMAFAVGIMRELRQHWPAFCYAIAGAAMPAILSNSVRGAGHWLHWSSLPWPLSQFCVRTGPNCCAGLGGIACLGGRAGDQRNLSLGQPPSDLDPQPGTDHAGPLFDRFLALVNPPCAGRSTFQVSCRPAGGGAGIVLFHVPGGSMAGVRSSRAAPACTSRTAFVLSIKPPRCYSLGRNKTATYSPLTRRALSNTSRSISAVSFPVDVFCWLG